MAETATEAAPPTTAPAAASPAKKRKRQKRKPAAPPAVKAAAALGQVPPPSPAPLDKGSANVLSLVEREIRQTKHKLGQLERAKAEVEKIAAA